MWNKCTTVEICQNAFRATGIFPINRFAIGLPDIAYAPSHTTERCLPEFGGGENTAAVGTSAATSSGDGDYATSHAVDTAASSASDFGGSDNVTSYVGDTTAVIVSTAADGNDGGTKVPSGATSVGDGGDGKVSSRVDERVSFRDLKKIPTRERSTARKRTKPPSSTLTSDKHFEFLSKSKKQPRTSKDKKKSVSAAVARGSKKKKLSKYKEKNAEDDTPCCVCGKRYNEPPADGWQQCTNCKLWFHDSCGPGETEFCYYCLG